MVDGTNWNFCLMFYSCLIFGWLHLSFLLLCLGWGEVGRGVEMRLLRMLWFGMVDLGFIPFAFLFDLQQ